MFNFLLGKLRELVNYSNTNEAITGNVAGNAASRMTNDGLEKWTKAAEKSSKLRKKRGRDAAPLMVISQPQIDANPQGCAICLENFMPGDTVRLLPCLHVFHAGTDINGASLCMDSAFDAGQTECPECRARIVGFEDKSPPKKRARRASRTPHVPVWENRARDNDSDSDSDSDEDEDSDSISMDFDNDDEEDSDSDEDDSYSDSISMDLDPILIDSDLDDDHDDRDDRDDHDDHDDDDHDDHDDDDDDTLTDIDEEDSLEWDSDSQY